MSVDLFTPEERFSLAGVNQRLAGINKGIDDAMHKMPVLLYDYTTEKSKDVVRVDLTTMEWDKWNEVIIYAWAKSSGSTSGYAVDLEPCSWSEPPYLGVITPSGSKPFLAVLYPWFPYVMCESHGNRSSASDKGISMIQIDAHNPRKTWSDLTWLSVYGISMNLPIGTEVKMYGIPK